MNANTLPKVWLANTWKVRKGIGLFLTGVVLGAVGTYVVVTRPSQEIHDWIHKGKALMLSGVDSMSHRGIAVENEDTALAIAKAIIVGTGNQGSMGSSVWKDCEPFAVIKEGELWIVRGKMNRKGVYVEFRISMWDASSEMRMIQGSKSTRVFGRIGR